MTEYSIENTNKNYAILSKREKLGEKYALKTFHTSSLEEHTHRIKYFKEYMKNMKDNMEVTRILRLIE